MEPSAELKPSPEQCRQIAENFASNGPYTFDEVKRLAELSREVGLSLKYALKRCLHLFPRDEVLRLSELCTTDAEKTLWFNLDYFKLPSINANTPDSHLDLYVDRLQDELELGDVNWDKISPEIRLCILREIRDHRVLKERKMRQEELKAAQIQLENQLALMARFEANVSRRDASPTRH